MGLKTILYRHNGIKTEASYALSNYNNDMIDAAS